jgi:hypothetical protein
MKCLMNQLPNGGVEKDRLAETVPTAPTGLWNKMNRQLSKLVQAWQG